MLALPDKSKDPKDALAEAWRAPIGAASPLWLMFAGAATAGVAFWWMSRWRAEATNLEAALPLPAAAPEPASPEPAAPEPVAVEAAPVIPAAELVEAAPEPAVDAAAEAPSEPVKAPARPRATAKAAVARDADA